MKNIIILFILSISLPLAGQVELPKPREVDKDYRRDYRKEVREYNRTAKRVDTTQWDVFLGPGQSVPTDVISAEEFRAMSYSNWWRDLVSPESLGPDMVAAAQRKGMFNTTDTGCDTDHPDLEKGKLKGSNYTADPCMDVHGHATHVAGITYLLIKPLIDAGWIEWKMSKFLGDRGQGSFAAIVGGVKEENAFMKESYIDQGKFAVANASWAGGRSIYQPLADELANGKKDGIVWIFAAGNTGGPVLFPGLLDQVSAVGSLDKNLQRSSFSSFGPELDFAAGGRNIYSTLPGGKYGSLSGTSMGAPAVTAGGLAAMCFHPELTAETLPAYLAKVSTDLGDEGKDDQYGWGLQYIRAIIDTPPDGGDPPPPPPDEPTCDDGKKNGDETGVDCGGPACPPCEPEEPEKPEYRKRQLTVKLSGPWIIGWWKSDRSRSITGRHSKTYDWSSADVLTLQDGSLTTANGVNLYELETVPLISPAGMSQIVVHELTYRVDSETTHTWEYEALKSSLDQFFEGNRAIGTGQMDAWDAGRYVPFWPDYYSCNEKGGSVFQLLTPVGAVLEWEGERILLQEKDLIDYRCRNKQ